MYLNDQLEIKPDNIDGEKNWVWIKNDKIGFDIISKEWLASHRYNYFKYVKKFDVVISAGGQCGMYTRFYARKFKKVYVFEPDPLNFLALSANNPYYHVIKFNAALGKSGFCDMKIREDLNRGMNKAIQSENGLVPIMSIDSFNFPVCDLIQLDTEGYEYDIICNAEKTIKKCKPVIILENGKKEKILNKMENLGYKPVENSQHDIIFLHNEH